MKSTITLSFLIFSLVISSQNRTPEQIVQENLDFYNQRNLEGFMTSFSKDIAIYQFEETKPSVVGWEEVKKVYSKLFENSPKLHSTIVKRITFDNKVIDHESIVGRNGQKDILELVLIYEVTNQKISKITVLRK